MIIYRNVQKIGGGVVDTGRCGAHYLQKITRFRGGEGDTPGDHLGPPGDHPHSGLYTI